MPVSLHDAKSIEGLVCPMKEYYGALASRGISSLIHNIHADFYLLECNGHFLPLLACQGNYSDAYVASSYTHYISYAKIEALPLIKNRFVAVCIKASIHLLGKLFYFGKLNQTLFLNHGFFSTDLHPELSPHEMEEIVSFLKERFPFHALVLRSLTAMTNAPLMRHLQKSAFHFIPSRYVWIMNGRKAHLFKTRILKSDLKLLRENPVETETEDAAALLALYESLYFGHNATLNPQYSEPFIHLLLKNNLLHFKLVKLDGVIKGMAGYWQQNGVMMCPFFGYDKTHPQSNTIYRLLNTAMMLEAKERGLIFNLSAGASFYKSVRRAKGSLEYIAVHARHLPLRQKLVWRLLYLFINTFAPKYMKKY